MLSCSSSRLRRIRDANANASCSGRKQGGGPCCFKSCSLTALQLKRDPQVGVCVYTVCVCVSDHYNNKHEQTAHVFSVNTAEVGKKANSTPVTFNMTKHGGFMFTFALWCDSGKPRRCCCCGGGSDA